MIRHECGDKIVKSQPLDYLSGDFLSVANLVARGAVPAGISCRCRLRWHSRRTSPPPEGAIHLARRETADAEQSGAMFRPLGDGDSAAPLAGQDGTARNETAPNTSAAGRLEIV